MENLIDEALKRRTAHMLQELGMKSKKMIVRKLYFRLCF